MYMSVALESVSESHSHCLPNEEKKGKMMDCKEISIQETISYSVISDCLQPHGL